MNGRTRASAWSVKIAVSAVLLKLLPLDAQDGYGRFIRCPREECYIAARAVQYVLARRAVGKLASFLYSQAVNKGNKARGIITR